MISPKQLQDTNHLVLLGMLSQQFQQVRYKFNLGRFILYNIQVYSSQNNFLSVFQHFLTINFRRHATETFQIENCNCVYSSQLVSSVYCDPLKVHSNAFKPVLKPVLIAKFQCLWRGYSLDTQPPTLHPREQKCAFCNIMDQMIFSVKITDQLFSGVHCPRENT